MRGPANSFRALVKHNWRGQLYFKLMFFVRSL